jgi:AcrR family transcriptional regulator
MKINFKQTKPAKNTAAPEFGTPAKSPAPSAVPISFPDMLATRPQPTLASSARERILFAAVEILNADGFGALTQTRAAERAGLRQSHVTYYFPTRNDLLRETAAFGCNTMIDVMAGAIDSGMLNIETLREFIAPDIHDRRFARLMCALTVASDEDESIKPWLKTFEAANRKCFILSFQKLGLVIQESDLEVFHATLVGSQILDLGESSAESLVRARRIAFRAFDASASPIKTSTIRNKSSPPKPAPTPTSTPAAKSSAAKKVTQRKSTR